MSYEKKEWKDRIAEYPTRRQLEKSDGSSELVTVSRAEGNISQEGDAFSAENMNALEKRISNGFEKVSGKTIPVTFLSIMNNTYACLSQSGEHITGLLFAVNDTPKNKVSIKTNLIAGLGNASSSAYTFVQVATTSGNPFGLTANQYTCVGTSLDRAVDSSGSTLSLVPSYTLALYNGTDTLLYCSVGAGNTTYNTTRYLMWIDYFIGI